MTKIGNELIEPISSVTSFDLAIEDARRLVLSGTGQWIPKIGTYRPQGSYFDLTLKTGEPYACTDPRFSFQCHKCPTRSQCPYSITASYPIIVDDKIKGLIGYLGYNHTQRDQFLKKEPVLMAALEKLASLISTLCKNARLAYLEHSSPPVEDILNEIREGIIFLDSRLRVTYANKAATTVLNTGSGELLGQRLHRQLPEVENTFKQGQQSSGSAEIIQEINTTITDRLHGTISIHQWNKPETRFLIFKDCFLYNKNWSPPVSEEGFEGILGASKAIGYTKKQAAKYAATDATILVVGETGVGKELFAHAIHKVSSRKNMPFITVNCAAIPEALTESELFGYECGAFSGAKQSGKLGKFEAAHGGTLFLDEIGKLSLNAQSKLLRAVEQMEVEKVGAVRPTKVDIRIIAATNHDLKTLVDRGKFREDLYYRLNILPLNVPALRERREDIQILMEHYLMIFGKPHPQLLQSLTPEILEILLSYEWPGNVRELKNVCQYLAVNYNGKLLLAKDLPPYMHERGPAGLEQKKLCGGHSHGAVKYISSSKGTIQSVNKALICQALNRFGHTTAGKRKAASLLGISLSTLYRKIKEYSI